MKQSSLFKKQKYAIISFIIFTFLSKGFAEDLTKNQNEAVRQPETAQELYEYLVNHTLVATTSFGNNFTEYHAKDGRVLGFNWNSETNVNSCWRVTGKNTVCYYYEQYDRKDVCWHYELVGSDTIRGYYLGDTNQTMAAKIEQGNSKNFTDNGINWSCSAQIISFNANQKQTSYAEMKTGLHVQNGLK